MSNYKKIIVLALIAIFTFSKCKTIKPNTQNPQKKQYSLIEKIYNYNTLNFNQITIKANYKISTQKNPFFGQIKILNDSLIKISIINSFGLPLVNLTATKDSVYINSFIFPNAKITYDSLYKILGIKISSNFLEKALTNQIFTYPDTNRLESYQILKNDSIIKLNYQKKFPNTPLTKIRNEISVDTKNMKIKQILIWDFSINSSELYINYQNFQNTQNLLFPKNISITHINFDTLKIDINIKNLKIE